MYERVMKEYKKLIYLLIFLIVITGCKSLQEETTETKNSYEITVTCGEDNELEKYINEGWRITKEYSEEKICSWKSVAATKNCDMDKDKGCRIIKPDKIGEEKIYLLEK